MGQILAKSITMDFMDNLEAMQGRLHRIPVKDCRGLFIQVSGKQDFPVKSWIYRFRIGEKQGVVTIGRYPDVSIAKAYAKADALRREVQDGNDPRQKTELIAPTPALEPESTPLTVNELIDRYVANKMGSLSESTRTEYKRMFAKKVRNHVDAKGRVFGDRPAVEITYTDAENLLRACRRGAERTATLIVIKMTNVWDYGQDIGELPEVRNIWSRQTKTAINDRDRRLSDQELGVLGNRLRTCQEREEIQIAYQLFLLTGMRHSNLAHCRWEWVDLESRWITIPKDNHKTGKKTKKPLQVLLSTYAVDLLKRLKALQEADPDYSKSPWLFPKAGDPDHPRDDLQDPWARITGHRPKPDKRRKADPRTVPPLFGEGKNKAVRIHDLRRTLASVLSDLGYKSYVGQILGHVTQGVTEVYTRTSAGPLMAMVEKAGAHIMAKMGYLVPTRQTAPLAEVSCPPMAPTPCTFLFTSVMAASGR
jgi:integrase